MRLNRFLPVSVLMSALIAATLACTGCSSTSSDSSSTASASSQTAITTGQIGVVKDTNFNGVMLDMTEEEFANLGFELGDSVDIVIDDTLVFEDVPYYNGYYSETGSYLLVSYPGEPHPNFKRAQSTLWDDLPVTEDSKICVTLRERGKYLDTQEALSMTYSNEAKDFPTDEAFANFRAINCGDLKENLIYRSASPIDNTYLRAITTNQLVQAAGIQYSLDLSDNIDEFTAAAEEVGSSCQYYKDLQAAGNVALLDLSSSFSNTAFKQSISAALYEMCQHQGPYLLHCIEGKDRTGFVCMLIEALCGATVDEMIDDYMITYQNYYNITEESDPSKYHAVVQVKAGDLLETISGIKDMSQITTQAMEAGAEKYLTEGGLTTEQIAQIKATLCK